MRTYPTYLAGDDWYDTASGFADLVGKAAKQAAAGGLTPGKLGGALAQQVLNEAASSAADTPLVQVNRARAAALVDYGYDKLDQYDRWRPYIFAGSAGTCALSVAAVIKRRKIAEAWPLYLVLAAMSGGLAWVTRPGWLRGAPAPLPTKQTDSPSSLNTMVGWLDRRVDQNTHQQPGWEAETWQRVAQDVGFSTIPPYAQKFFTANSR